MLVPVEVHAVSTKEFDAMRTIVSAAALAFALTGAALAQGTTSPGTGSTNGATKMSQADCTASWTQLDASKKGSVSKAQAQPMVTDFDAADTNKDGNLSQTEFMSACQKGLVTASKGTGAGSRGMTGTENSKPGSGTTTPGGTSK
jgi:hypothetical protein